jgi:glyoxalase-like protein
MADYLRLRQICLVARELEPVLADIRAILGLEICHRDSGVAKYGLVNALLPIGTSFLEVVAPVEANTAAGRFLDRSGGHGGYMAIFDCSDPERRRRHAEALGIRVANVIEYAEYLGIQLHPRDCRAAMIELNHTRGGDDLTGAYHPAGPNWRAAIRTDQAKALVATEIETPEPEALARHWGNILELPVRLGERDPTIALAHGDVIRFVAAPDARTECLGGLRIDVADVGRACATAAARGYQVEGNSLHLAGVHFRLQPAV